MAPARVLLIVPKLSYRTEDFLSAARRLGVEVTLVSDRCHVLAEEWPQGALPIELHRADEAVEAMVREAEQAPVHGVVGVDDVTTVLASRVAARLKLRHNPPGAAERARHKKLQRQTLSAAGVPVPAFFAGRVDDDPESLARQIPYPCVLKPVGLTGSRGVIRADDPAEFVAAFHRLRRLLTCGDVAARRDAALSELLVEAFIPGMEHALEGLLEDGRLEVLALFDKPDPLDGPFFEESIYVTPSRLSRAAQEDIALTVERAATALGLREGPVHAEVRLNDAGVWILEVAARTIGGLCARTLRFGAGLSLEELVLSHAVGQRAPSLERDRQAAGVMMIPIPKAGLLRRTRGLEKARAVDGVEDVIVTVPEGHSLVPLPEGAGYLGFIFGRAASPDSVERALREAHKQLHFEISPVLPVARS